MDNAAFRAAFPEFSSTTKYPDSMLNFWATLGSQVLSADLFEDTYDSALYLFVAHSITIAAQNVKASATGGTPGSSGGIAASKGVGSTSVGYDVNITAYKDAGIYNQTTYGRQLYSLILLFGAGCINL